MSGDLNAQALWRLRRRRDEVFGSDHPFGEPSWDMLLALYHVPEMSISGTCSMSGAPDTTALRHANRLVGSGIVARRSDPFDGRREWLRLSVQGRSLLDRVLIDPMARSAAGVR